MEVEEEEEQDDYPHYYSDDWKTSDYKYWNRQTRDLVESDNNQDLVKNMVVGLADRVSNAVNMIA